MNTKTTLLVLLVAAGLATYFILYETEPKKPAIAESEAPTIGQSLFTAATLPQDKVKLLRLRRGVEPEAVVENDAANAGDWTQTAPVRFAMQSYRIQELLSAGAGLRYSSSFTPAGKKLKLDELGLAPPQASVTFEGEGIAKTTISLGSRTAAGRAYATLGPISETSTVYVVDDRLHELLAVKISQMRSVSLPGPNVGSARRITLMRDGVLAQLVNKDSRWTMTDPATGRADRAIAESLISAIPAASIERFIEDNPARLSPFGLDKPQILLTVETAEPTPPSVEKKDTKPTDQPPPTPQKLIAHKLAIGSGTDLDNSSYYAMWNNLPVVFTLRKADVERFQKKPDDLRDPAITPAARADVKELTLDRSGPAGKIHFTVDQGKWVFGDPKPGFTLDVPEFDKLLDAIFKAKAVSFDAQIRVPLTSPLATIKMAVNQAEPEVLTLHAAQSPDKLLVLRNDESTGYIINRASLAAVFEPTLAFRDRNIIDVMPDALAAIKITRPGKFAAQYEITREAAQPQGPPVPGSDGKTADTPKPGEWKLDGIDKDAFARLMAALAPLRATKWLSEAPVSGPDDPVVEIKTMDGKVRSLTLHVATRSGKVAGVDKAFELDPSVQEAVNADLLEKAVLKLELDQISLVKGGDWTLKRNAGKFKYEGGGELDETKAAAIYNVIAELRALRFIDVSRAVGNPATTLTFTVSGKNQTLKIWTPKDTDPVVQLGDKVFTITPEIAAILTAKPVAQAAEP